MVRPVLLLLAALNLVQGLAIVVAPREFFDAVADFGAYSPHALRDVATVNLALGVAFLVAAGRPSWRVPVLALAALQAGIHAINHFADIPDAESTAVGWFDAITLTVLTAIYAGLARRADA